VEIPARPQRTLIELPTASTITTGASGGGGSRLDIATFADRCLPGKAIDRSMRAARPAAHGVTSNPGLVEEAKRVAAGRMALLAAEAAPRPRECSARQRRLALEALCRSCKRVAGRAGAACRAARPVQQTKTWRHATQRRDGDLEGRPAAMTDSGMAGCSNAATPSRRASGRSRRRSLLREQVEEGDIAMLVGRWRASDAAAAWRPERQKLLETRKPVAERVMRVPQPEAWRRVAASIRGPGRPVAGPRRPVGSFPLPSDPTQASGKTNPPRP